MISRVILIFFIFAFLSQSVIAASPHPGRYGRETYTVTLPKDAIINYFPPPNNTRPVIGFVEETKEYVNTDVDGVVLEAENTLFENPVKFSRLVAGSYTSSSWQLTTEKPLGVAVTYNTNGRIYSEFSSLTDFDSKDLSIYPSVVSFGVSSGVWIKGRIFKFYPIIRVDKDVHPVTYDAKFNFIIEYTDL